MKNIYLLILLSCYFTIHAVSQPTFQIDLNRVVYEIKLSQNGDYIVPLYGSPKAFITRISKTGKVLWSKNYSRMGFIAVTKDNGFVSFDEGGRVFKCDSAGNIQGSERITHVNYHFANSRICEGVDGSIYINGGWFNQANLNLLN